MFLTKYLILILVLIYCSTNFVNGDNFLILHPFYSGSHVLTLHHVAESLVSRGHKVFFFQDSPKFIWLCENPFQSVEKSKFLCSTDPVS